MPANIQLLRPTAPLALAFALAFALALPLALAAGLASKANAKAIAELCKLYEVPAPLYQPRHHPNPSQEQKAKEFQA